MTPQPVTTSRRRFPRGQAGGGCLASSVYVVVLVAGAAVLWVKFYDPLREMIASQRWERVPAKIDTSRVDPGKATGTYAPRIGYYYWVPGETKPRRSTRIWFLGRGSDTKADVEALVARYPEKLETHAYVNPDNPEEVILQRGFKPALLIALIPLGMILVGLAGLTSMVWRRAVSRAHLHPVFPGPRTHQSPSGLPALPDRRGPVTRRARRGLKSGLTFVLLIAVAWNSMMFFLAREVINNWRGQVPGPYGLLLTLFSLPFLLAGVLLMVVPVFIIRRLFLPRPTVTLSEPMVALGASIEVSWRVSGRIDRVRRLRVLLEGREEATYERNDVLRTDSEVFASFPLFVTQHPQQIRAGRCTLAVPEDAAPSFESHHNKIAWAVRVQTDSRPWPGFNEEFELLVLPTPSPATGDRSPSPAQPSPEARPA